MKRLSTIVPVYNEGVHLKEVLEFLFKSECPLEREWIIIDDHSSDGSCHILRELQSLHKFKLIEKPYNSGKGAAIRLGIQASTGDYVMIQDADFEYDPRDIPELLKPLETNQADVVYGSRFKKNSPQVHRTLHYFVNYFLTVCSNLLSGIYLTDMETCYKVFRSDLLKAMKLKSNRFGVEIELTAFVAKTSARVFEIPIRYHPRTVIQGKKITWKDGMAALFHLVRFNLFTTFEMAFKDLPRPYRPGNPLIPAYLQSQS